MSNTSKEAVASKIQKFGRVGQILLKISMAVCGFFGILCLVIAITALLLPKNLLNVEFDNGMRIHTTFPKPITEEEMAQAQQIIIGDNSALSLNDTSYKVDSVTCDETSLSVVGSTDTNGFNMRYISLAMFIGFVVIASTWVCLYLIASLCGELKRSESPFTDSIIKKLNYVAISLIPMVVLFSIGSASIRSILTGGATLRFNFNAGSFIMVILIFGLVQVFKYGAMLQLESDETL